MSERDIREQAAIVTGLLPKVMRRLFAIDADDPAMDLPIAQVRVCGVLHDGPKTMSMLSRELGISHSATTQLADRLERAGLVERVVETDDRRVKCLQLTMRGAQIMEKRGERRVRRAEDALSGLTPRERAEIISALETLLDASTGAELVGAKDSDHAVVL
jgi:DNA-binding MarR family transcriptional regulator